MTLMAFARNSASSTVLRAGVVVCPAGNDAIRKTFKLRMPQFKTTASAISGSYSSTTSSWLPRVAHQLKQIARLRDGWNSYGSPRPSKLARERAKRFLELLHTKSLEPSRLAASAVGGIGFTFWRDDREVYVEFQNDGYIGRVMTSGADEPLIDPIRPERQELGKAIDRICEYLYAKESGVLFAVLSR